MDVSGAGARGLTFPGGARRGLEVAWRARWRTGVGRVLPSARFFAESVLRAYAQVLFSRSPAVGAVLCAATWFSPHAAALGLAGAVTAVAVARMMGLSRELVHAGAFGYSALLVGLGCGALFGVDARALGVAVIGAAATVPIAAALHGVLTTTFALPVLALPFLGVFALVVASAPACGLTLLAPSAAPTLGLPAPLAFFAKSLGTLFFVPREDAGLLVALGLVLSSRIAFALAALGVAGAWALAAAGGATGLAAAPSGLSYNLVLTCIALGGIWFVPSRAALLLACAGAVLCALIERGTAPLFGKLGISAAILPFNAAVLFLLLAMRQRARDGSPKAVDFIVGSPEENLRHHATRVRRFGARYTTRFAAPFLGRWTCTQGVDGAFTHRGAWREALDFEVQGADGRFHSGAGDALPDFHCYRLPVLAAAAGTVVRVVDGVPDNAVGALNLHENWGNVVVVQHAVGLYSLVAHLSPGTLRVREGQWVRQGDMLGGCGNSGRSAVPHLHFQLQATPQVGAPSIAMELHDVVLEGSQPRLRSACVPALGAVVRNLEAPTDHAPVQMARDVPMRFAHDGGRLGKTHTEEITCEIDLLGRETLRSSWGAALYFERLARLFTVYDTLGPKRSLLHLWRVALPRVPSEHGALTWSDQVPHEVLSGARGPWWRVFANRAGLTVDYEAQRVGPRLVITGRSRRRDAQDMPRVRTEAILTDGVGLERLRVSVAGRTRSITRAPRPHEAR